MAYQKYYVWETDMNWRVIFITLFTIFLFSFQITAKEEKTSQPEWKEVKNSKGVRVYKRPRAGSKYNDLLAQITIAAPFEVALEFVKDCNSYHTWYGMCNALYVTKKISEKEFYMYFVLDTPMLTDRDVVVRVTMDWDIKKKTGWIKLKSVDSDYKNNSGLVRMPQLDGGFTLKEVGPDKFLVNYRVYADLGGSVPAWMVNIVSKKHPFDTACGARRTVKLEKYYKNAEKLYGKSFKRYN